MPKEQADIRVREESQSFVTFFRMFFIFPRFVLLSVRFAFAERLGLVCFLVFGVKLALLIRDARRASA